MSYDALDTGQSTSSPFLCFRFDAGGVIYRYTTAETPVILDGEEYEPDVLSVEPLRLEPNQTDQRMAILTRQDLPIIGLLTTTRPRLRVRIYEAHRTDPTALRVFWSGAVIGVSLRGVEARLIADTGALRVNGLIPQQMFGQTCQWTLGRPWCPVDLADYTHAGVLSAVGGGGRVLTSADWTGFEDGYFVNGHVVTADGRVEVIERYDAAAGELTLGTALSGLAVGDGVDAVAGCDGEQETCAGRFGSDTGDGDAWGGFFIPAINPVKGGVL